MWTKFVSWRTNTSSGDHVQNKSSGAITNAFAIGVNHKSKLRGTRYAVAIFVKCVSGRTYAIFVFVKDEASSRRTSLNRCALNRCVAFIAFNASTCHSSDGQGVQNFAKGVDAARVGQFARVLTLCIYTSSLARTIAIRSTNDFGLFTSASRSFPSRKSRRARAISLVIDNPTFGRRVTRIRNRARILANLVNASLVRWAIRIGITFNVIATDIGITQKPDGASTNGLMGNSRTVGVSSTGKVVHPANRGTFSKAAGMSLLTFGIRLTSKLLAEDFRVSVEARDAGAHGAVVDNVALGVETATAGVFTNGIDTGSGF